MAHQQTMLRAKRAPGPKAENVSRPDTVNALTFADDRPEAVVLRKLSDAMNDSPRLAAQRELAEAMNNRPRMAAQRKPIDPMSAAPAQLQGGAEEDELLQGQFVPLQRAEAEEEDLLQGKFEPVQRQGLPEEEELLQGKFEPVQRVERESNSTPSENNTGLPDHLKSGLSLDSVKVHYNSSQPAQLNALAYAQDRVKPTMQLKEGISVNDDKGLENEADVMGAKAFTSSVQLAKQGDVGKLELPPASHEWFAPPTQLRPLQRNGVVQPPGVIQRFDPLTIGLGLAALGSAAYGGYRYLRHRQRENTMNSIRAEQERQPRTDINYMNDAPMDSPSLVSANNPRLPQNQRTYRIDINANNPVGHERTSPEEMRIAKIHERTHISADQAYSANRDISRLELFHEDPANEGAEYLQTYKGIENRTTRLRKIAINDKSLTAMQRKEILSRIDYAEKPVEYDPVVNELLAYSKEYKIPANSGTVKALVTLANENLARRQPNSPIMNEVSPI